MLNTGFQCLRADGRPKRVASSVLDKIICVYERKTYTAGRGLSHGCPPLVAF